MCESESSRSSKLIENGQVLEYLSEDCRTMYDVLRQGAKASNNGPCLGYRKKMPDNSRPYVWINFNDVIRRCNNFAQGLLSLGLKPGGETFVGLYSINLPYLSYRKNCHHNQSLCRNPSTHPIRR
ncbi:Long-chain-fatty-acid--CoA ligase 1 [Trichinella zimbabwensis]|uniref:Long-chain-fatty-acid--CoA ligase 1 n=1 Tax=Trichinella zimbabwensis TaxID=268475 RepID=A0A0V1HTZ5_9BILA|nr:Long-chain-fatty-acid--CoA ligase 1 [Trichinella zimbabwensis]